MSINPDTFSALLDRYMESSQQVYQIQKLIEDWDQKQGHDRCWYYPEIFVAIAKILDIPLEGNYVSLPTREEFDLGCRAYANEVYSKCPQNN